ncbi:MAG: potassium transporter [Sulfurimonas sp. RIFCSPHIGHO2_12_FULL_36_9]|uniref:cation:proton antiporter domain-containing protein n=1 Tax=Sulfurimonas sp. RIFCSPLOWO2_12_36_12 TaxID=1802253 RepID=UPI0008C81D9B|nr:cation:proton antiporter [Sulfurimonas sp. RIFCSPLOWO2_12_36_12]OHD97628.1 MAG: potassium transporter [Sulfurimonas sp. RIFCSPLOWO2_02_FULL_36_28]OHD98968.1 MAG: potassium transporter [Sulfurimonas sp. RIFCSPHIGHO2_12_FULL_36_9]OHE00621.1 MAG: potassium transporter [Sulfurimonas sp. RIFCSPLOWO2_12_36_12]OHE05354.1 MAG: potassium transporter [Sulfurimonas sp. RIFCSPLOWO2_12_FULL_36_74]
MEFALLYIVTALGISTVLNLILKRFGISQIIGYILTGTIIVYAFDLRHMNNSATLTHIAEFGIVFLMFTIGLEISLAKMNSMKKEIFVNGFMQVGFTALIVYGVSHYLFSLKSSSALILSLAFALSSTAVVLSYLKSSKEINNPYGQRATGILIFQDIAVIPILIFLSFLTASADQSIAEIIKDTIISAVIIIGFMFVIGKRVMTWLLHFSASSEVDELFMGSVLFIVVSAALLASYMGFTYSLGAFVAGMIIAETKYYHKVESDIAPFKDILLGTFFIVVGMKIDVAFFMNNIGLIVGIFLLVLVLKTLVTYLVVRISSSHVLSLKTALALSQVGEFSFVIFAVASMGGLLDEKLESLFVLVVIFSMIVTPFFISKINRFVSFVSHHQYLGLDNSAFTSRTNHVIVCGYSIVGKFVAKYLDEMDAPYVIIDNNPKHVQEALVAGKEAYLGDMSKLPLLEALHAESSAAVIVTLDNFDKKRAVCEAVLKHTKNINLIVKISTLEDKEGLADLNITSIVDSKLEVGRVLVEKMTTCKIGY